MTVIDKVNYHLDHHHIKTVFRGPFCVMHISVFMAGIKALTTY